MVEFQMETLFWSGFGFQNFSFCFPQRSLLEGAEINRKK